jgi:histone demethylase JARID1
MRDGDMDAADIICAVCGLGDRPNKLVVCENDCMNGCHIDCMSPPLASIPRRKWYCPRCDEESSSDDTAEEESYGYDEGKEYTLSQFARNANAFERQWFSDHYRGNVFYPPTARELETSYWDIVEKAEDKVHVYYGSDLDVGDHGSGFPADISRKCPENARWRRQLKEFPPLEQSSDYMIKSGWNLNNLAHVSVLQHLGQSVAGVTRPMLYVGMLFSSFCWHTEDNFMYRFVCISFALIYANHSFVIWPACSINYVHTGAAKRWYGIPGNAAEKFEEAMRQEVPELFEQQPNLLFLLVTQMSPKRLEKYGVPVYTTLQQEGEFVVTFPRSYHAGFNCGVRSTTSRQAGKVN